MGRCNGGGGRRTGGGGFQEGQCTGKKTGKTGHGRNSDHAPVQREQQRFDKTGKPLNYGPFRNGYYVADKKPQAQAQAVGIAAEQVAALSLLASEQAAAGAVLAQEHAPPPNGGTSFGAAGGAGSSAGATSSASSSIAAIATAKEKKKKAPPAAIGSAHEMSAAQRKESERLTAAQAALDAAPEHAKMRQTRARLPAFESRAAVVEAVRAAPSLVICGETGCGKSTQVPQYILEDAVTAGTGAACTILIAQPRRVAAISLAERVAAERGEAVGESVGYSIRHEGAHSKGATRLLFCTTGVILRRLQEDSNLHGVSHVIMDEAHERTADGDFLLMVLKQLLVSLRRGAASSASSSSTPGGAGLCPCAACGLLVFAIVVLALSLSLSPLTLAFSPSLLPICASVCVACRRPAPTFGSSS